MDITTELSAVNALLATIGEAPISSLEESALVDVAIARAAIREVTRSVLIDGWSFNTDTDFPLSPEGFAPFAINIPRNAMVVTPNQTYSHITPRGDRLYNTTTFSFNFQGHEAVPCQIIWLMDFSELPEVTRQYVAIRAARLFQARTTASEILHAFTNEDERYARLAHQRNNTRIRRINYLTDNGTSASILAR
jgi:hypothetical protein